MIKHVISSNYSVAEGHGRVRARRNLHRRCNGAEEEVLGEISSSDSSAIGEESRFSHTIATTSGGSDAQTKRKKGCEDEEGNGD